MTELASPHRNRESYNPLLLFVGLCVIAYGINYTANNFIVTEDIYLDYFGDQYTFDKIKDFIKFQKQWQWLTYLLLPISYFLKILLVTFCLVTGLSFYDRKIEFWRIFRWALVCEFVFVIPALIKVAWFGLVKTDFSLLELYAFSPLSMMNLMDLSTIEEWLIYPLQTISIFEAAYILLLSYGLKSLVDDQFTEALKITSVFYGCGMLLWLAVVAYLNLSFSS